MGSSLKIGFPIPKGINHSSPRPISFHKLKGAFPMNKLVWLVLLSTVSVMAKPMVQSRYNGQLQVQNLATVSRSVDQLCRECQAQITNFNCDANSGSLNARVPEEQLGRFCEGLQRLGQMRSQNRSTSDNTSSYQEYKRQLEMAEKAMSAQWTVSGSGLTGTEKGLVDAEFRAFLRDRINSYRSNLANLEQNQGFAEVSVNLTGPQVAPEQQVPQRVSQPVQMEVISETPAPTNLMTKAGPLLLLVGLLAVLFSWRLGRRTPPPS